VNGWRYRLHFIVAALGVTLMTVSCSSASDQTAPEPSQRALTQLFRTNRQEFEFMRSLANRKPRITGMFEPDQPIYGETPSGNVPLNDRRIALLRRAMNQLHVVWLRNIGDVTTFTVWLGPASLKDRMSKGVAYSSKAAVPVYHDVDSSRNKRTSSEWMYAPIERNWYVFWDWGEPLQR
jgi:hypothetical protein